MITPKDIRELLQAKPFRPFRICLSDGGHFDIIFHDAVLVGAYVVEIGLDLNAEGFADRFVRCSISHITRLEDLLEGTRVG